MSKEITITLGELRERLNGYSDDYEVIFGSGNLEFYRVKRRGDNLIQIEFNQNTNEISNIE